MATTEFRRVIPPKRILVVEDEVLAAQTIRTILTVDGHSVEIAAEGEQAMALFLAGDYDLVITDFKLGTIDGLELAAAMKQRSPVTPIILVTAYADKVSQGMGKVSNIDLLLSKPISVAQLHEAMAKLFPAR